MAVAGRRQAHQRPLAGLMALGAGRERAHAQLTAADVAARAAQPGGVDVSLPFKAAVDCISALVLDARAVWGDDHIALRVGPLTGWTSHV